MISLKCGIYKIKQTPKQRQTYWWVPQGERGGEGAEWEEKGRKRDISYYKINLKMDKEILSMWMWK